MLWIKRKTEPYAGQWAIPSGFLEENETPQQAAAREVQEETNAIVDQEQMELHTVGSLPAINQVYLVFRAPLVAPTYSATAEAEEVRLLSSQEVPYEDFAYPDVIENVRGFYEELEAGQFKVHLGALIDGNNVVKPVRMQYP